MSILCIPHKKNNCIFFILRGRAGGGVGQVIIIRFKNSLQIIFISAFDFVLCIFLLYIFTQYLGTTCYGSPNEREQVYIHKLKHEINFKYDKICDFHIYKGMHVYA